MSFIGSTNNSWDNMQQIKSAGVAQLHLEQLKELTDDFSEDRLLGAGTYGKVYKGVQKNGEEIAVKMIGSNGTLDKYFRELLNHVTLSHPNIVRVIGYCEDEIPTIILHMGRYIIASKIHRALCLEYMHNGSLQKHISEECDGLDWQARYKIIKGICEGLEYLHNGCRGPIFHLDLKPDNILLDRNMVPKLADFGISPFGRDQTAKINWPVGTLGYLPPEYINSGMISNKVDIFSLGVVMIKIIAGPSGYSNSAEMPPVEFINLVQGKWRNRLQATSSNSLLDGYCHQVKICTEIALNCLEIDMSRRPSTGEILNRLNDTETTIVS